jgi:hypothetical protein
MRELLDAFVHGEGATEHEDHDRHHERPKVAFPGVSEWMFDRGLSRGARATEEQQRLVAAVCDRMHGLGQHRRRARQRKSYELGHRDAQIRAQCRDYGLLTAFVHLGGRL